MKEGQKSRVSKIAYYLMLSTAVFFAIQGLIQIGQFTGFATHEAQGGTITELEVIWRPDATLWAGVYGYAVRFPGITQTWSESFAGGNMRNFNILFDCIPPSGQHELYASLAEPSTIDWDSLTPATVDNVNTFLGVAEENFQSATRTFLDSMWVEVGATNITGLPGTYTYVYDKNRQAKSFPMGVLIDSLGNILYFARISTNFTWGFNNQLYNFQMILPVPESTNQIYYFMVDPNNFCPSGQGDLPGMGSVTGIVIDETGYPVNGTIVEVAGYVGLTNEQGNYTLTTVIGNHSIYAIKTEYEVYHSEVEVIANTTVHHNIILIRRHIKDEDEQEQHDQLQDLTQLQINPNLYDQMFTGRYNQRPHPEEPKRIEGTDYIVSVSEINRKLRRGNYIQEQIFIISYKKSTAMANFEIKGDIANIIQIDRSQVFVNPNAKESVTLTIFGRGDIGVYNGTIEITGDLNASIPVEIEILDKEKLPVEALLLDLQLMKRSITIGEMFKFETQLRNLLSDQSYPVKLYYTIQTPDMEKTIWTYQTNLFITTGVTLLKEIQLPNTMEAGDYIITVTATYLGLSSATSTQFKVTVPFWQYRLFGRVPVWWILAFLAFLLGVGVAYFFIKRNIESKKKFHLKVEYSELPKPGPRSIFVGKIAETDHNCYFDIEKFKVHTIVAGSTGGGKSFSAQGVIEEMLLKNVAVMVFDPTAQWTGMLRKQNSKFILDLYAQFGMKKEEARAFNGNIKEVRDKRELIDIKKYMKPGEIQVFACHRLDPKDMDMFVANVIREVFHARFDESPQLRLMLVFDEVHRLLPKFGGSGDGFLQIERGCREFRKWGIGILLISQVLADFMGQIKANINTEIQMRTRDEGDLERIRVKYGEEVLRSLVKATVGSGMVENPAYNRGKPFFVAFRPLLHSVERLSDKEIEEYTKYNFDADNLFYSLEQLEKEGVDVFDLKLELKLAQDKIKTGNFNMVKIYLEGIIPRIDKHWEKLGKKPQQYEIKKISEEDMQEAIQAAKNSRDEYLKTQKKGAAGGEGEAPAKPKTPEELFKMDVPPDKILNLANGMVVINLNSLFDELSAIKKDDFEKDVNYDKHKVADWIRDAVGDKDLADHIANIIDKKEICELLAIKKKGEKLPPIKPKPEKPKEEGAPGDAKAPAQQPAGTPNTPPAGTPNTPPAGTPNTPPAETPNTPPAGTPDTKKPEGQA